MGSSIEEAISASIAEKAVPVILAAVESRMSRERDEMRQAVTEMTLVRLPAIGYVRLPQILAVIPIGPTTWWEWIKAGIAPSPIKWGSNVSVWAAEEILALIAKLRSGLPPGGEAREREATK